MTVSIVFLAAAASLAAALVDAEDATPWTIDIGTRSYDGTWWFCQDKTDRPIPAKYATPKSREGQSFADLNENERPMMRKMKNKSIEPDVLDDGNAWVAFVKGDKRIAYLVSSEGFHPAVCTKTGRVSLEDISGNDYIDEMPYKTKPLTFEQLDEIARKVGTGKVINEPYKSENYLYKGTDFVIELILAVTDEATQKQFKLRESGNRWPPHFHLLDVHYNEFYGQSAFENNGIPIGTPPARAAMEEMRNIKDVANKPRQ